MAMYWSHRMQNAFWTDDCGLRRVRYEHEYGGSIHSSTFVRCLLPIRWNVDSIFTLHEVRVMIRDVCVCVCVLRIFNSIQYLTGCKVYVVHIEAHLSVRFISNLYGDMSSHESKVSIGKIRTNSFSIWIFYYSTICRALHYIVLKSTTKMWPFTKVHPVLLIFRRLTGSLEICKQMWKVAGYVCSLFCH